MLRHTTISFVHVLIGLVFLLAGIPPVATAQEKLPDWPVELTRDDMTVIVYSPQIDTFEGDSLTARSAIAVTPKSTN